MGEIRVPHNPKKRRKLVVLLEHEGHVKDCMERFEKIKGKVIALSPFAMYELDKQNFPYKLIEDYYDPKEVHRLGIGNYQKVENLCGMIDRSIQDACPTAAESGIRPAMFSFLDVKVLYDTVTIRLFQLSKLIDAESPAGILAYTSKQIPFRNISGIDYRESIYTQLLALHGWDIPVELLPHVPYPENSKVSKRIHKSRSATLKKAMGWWLQHHPKLFDLVAEANKRGWRASFGRLKSYPHTRKDIQVILFGQGLNWDDCREQLQSVEIDPIFNRMRDNLEYWMSDQFPEKANAGALLNAWEGLRADDKFREFFIWDHIDFFPVLEERLKFLVERLTPACLNAYGETARILKNRKVKAFLSSALDSCTSHSASQAAQNFNVPVVIWQHAISGVMDHPIVHYTDLMGADVFFSFGEGAADKYTEPAKRFGTRPVSIGSPSLEALHRMPEPDKAKRFVKLDPGKKVVLYALPVFLQNNLYVSRYLSNSDNHLWRAQRAILDVLGKHDEYTVVVKLKPSGNRDPPVREYAKENKFKNCQFIRGECTFTDLLPIADLVVLNSPSTTLLEALITSKPIFLYTRGYRLDARAKKLLERRVFYYQDSKSMANALDKYLSEGKIDKKVDLNDKEFLKAYGVSSQGEGSGIRAARMLKEIMSGAQ